MSTPSESRIAIRGYHHGNLVEALIEATITLIEEKGVENLTVRDVAKKAGVSSGAPFRHFASKTALLTAVAEQAMARLTASVGTALAEVPDGRPLDRLHAMGRAYLGWALENPTHFQIISSRTLIDFRSSERLVKENEDLRLIMIALIGQAQANGELRSDIEANDLLVSARGFAYGIARMWVDGHYSEWKITRPPAEQMDRALHMFFTLLRSR